jgi:hypothetical protein
MENKNNREDFSQRLKESVKEDKSFCKQLVDRCEDIHLLIDLCAQIWEEHDLIVEKYERCLKVSVEEDLTKAYFWVKTLCANIQEKYDQPWVLSKILELNVDEEEWDDSKEDANRDEVLPPNDQEFISEEPPYLEHALDEEDCTSQGKNIRRSL